MNRFQLPSWATYCILFVAAFLFVFLFSCTTSPIYEHYPFWFHGDSGIFQEMGVCLVHGGTPYVDLFDHKGPVLWFIQALGIWISPQWGLIALQTLSLFCSMLLWYRTSCLLVKKQIISFIITNSGLLFLLAFYQRGNLCEEWCLPFISLPIYLYVKRFDAAIETRLPIYNHTDAIFIGLCVGIIAMIRLNNTAPIIGFVLWHFVKCLQSKEYKRLWKDIILICSGMVIIFILCALLYLLKDGWNGVYEMIYGTFVFNFMYIIHGSDTLTISMKIQLYTPIVLCLITLLIILINKRFSNDIVIPLTISYFITLLVIGGLGFIHYMMVFIPLIVINICVIIQSNSHWLYIVLGFVAFSTLHLGYDAVDHLLFRLKGEQANTELNDGFHRFITSLSDDEKHSIYNAGLNHMGAGLFADENIYQCNRFIYDGHLEMSTHLQEYEKSHGIKDLQPAWILTQSPRPEVCNEYIATNYILADSIPGGEYDPIWCWKKNLTDLTEP